MERFYLDQNISEGILEISDPEIFHKIKSVLRGQTGEQIAIFGNNQKEFIAEIEEVAKKTVRVKTLEEVSRGTEPKIKLILYPSLIKKNRFEVILEKCTEIGVSEFQPIISERGVVKTGESPERWQKIIIEAAQQSGRVSFPKIGQPVNLEEALAKIKTGAIILAAENHSENNPAEQLKNAGSEIHLFIGPEGGWSPKEIEIFKKHNPIILNLGVRILRAETASIVFSAFCVYLGQQ